MQINIMDYPNLIDAINRELSAGNIVEVKMESQGLACVKIDRKIKYREEKLKKER